MNHGACSGSRGRVAYTAGVAFFAADRVRYGHWLAPVRVAGSACHYVAVTLYAFPSP
jgi:predicted membrane channel-forming protein YqfA (hemolysin III family)